MPSPPLPLFSLSTQSNPPLKKPSPSPVPPPRLLRTCRTSPKQHLQCPIPTVCKEKEMGEALEKEEKSEQSQWSLSEAIFSSRFSSK